MLNLNVKKIVLISILIICILGILIISFYLKKKKDDQKTSDQKIKNKIEYFTVPDRNNLSMEEYYQRGIYPSTYKVVVLGDVHGDYYATVKSLKNARLIDENLDWCGGKTHLVQIGDILDRKNRLGENTDEDSEFGIIYLFLKLIKQAYEAGGGFHCILGNHELMNISGDFSYVSDAGINHFPDKAKGRLDFFKPNSKMCKLFASYWNPVIKIGKYLFCHAGISYKIGMENSIHDINNLMRNFLLGDNTLLQDKKFDELFMNDKGIVWNREYMNGDFDRNKTKEMLKNKDCEYMVVGHTIQDNGINLKNDCIWFVDTGMSEAFGKRISDDKIQLLQILSNGKQINIIN